MIISIGNSFTHITQLDENEQAWLWGFLSFEDTSAEMRRRSGYKVHDDRIRLFSRKNSRFPTGLLPIVRAGAERAGIELTEVDARGPAPPINDVDLTKPPWRMTGKYAFQAGAIRDWLAGGPDEMSHPLPGRGIIWSPTASGKGSLAVAVAHMLPGHTLFAVHRGHLAEDIQDRWNTMAVPQGEPPAGIIGEGRWEPGERFTCTTLQTLFARRNSPEFKELTKRTTGLIYDEFQTAAAKTFNTVMAYLHQARWRLGISGTPLDRSDERSMVAVGAIGPVVCRVKYADLQKSGVLALATVHIVPITQGQSSGATWHERYDRQIVNSTHRNGAVLAAAKYAYDNGETPGMVFVTSLRHGSLLTKKLNALGITSRFISGSAKLHTRKAACEQLANGRLDFIVATRVFSEGVNIPSLRTVISAQAGKSVVTTLQQIGRGMRVTATKKTMTLWDFGDKGDHKFNEHAKARIAAYQREGYRCIVDTNLWPEAGQIR